MLPMLHGHGNIKMDTTHGYVADSKNTHDTYARHVSDTTRLHDRSVCATLYATH